jgi:hypothetical protein
MTSQLNVDTIVDKAGSGGTNVKIGNTSTYVSEGGAVTQNTVQGLTKHLCHWDGTGTPAVDDSFNNSSLTDNGTGDFTQNFTNNMGNVFYISNGHGYYNGSEGDTAAPQWALKDVSGLAAYKLTSSMRGETVFQNTGANRSNYDYPANWSSLDGDLA